jgi:hypothetical protein
MRKSCEYSAGKYCILIVGCLALTALVSGCASAPKAPKQTVFPPAYSDSSCQAAVKAGALAMADCSRERVVAKLENRAPDYAKAREGLAGALAALQPGKVSPSKPEFERVALCFEKALAGMDRVMAGQKQGDQEAQSLGWEMFDQSAGDLLLALEPHAGAAVKSPAAP